MQSRNHRPRRAVGGPRSAADHGAAPGRAPAEAAPPQGPEDRPYGNPRPEGRLYGNPRPEGRLYDEPPPEGRLYDEPGPADASSGVPRHDDPWYDALASGWGESAGGGGLAPVPQPARRAPARDTHRAAADVYLEVQRSAAFQEVRRRYRRFVVPAGAAFLLWYVAYVVAATSAPALMARPVIGAVNVALLAGLGQFLSTFLFTWAYARHARLRRDRAALELRWDTQEMTRGVRGGAL